MIKNKEYVMNEVKDYVFITLGLLLYIHDYQHFIINRSPEDFGLPIHDENHLCHLCPILHVNVCTKSNAFGC